MKKRIAKMEPGTVFRRGGDLFVKLAGTCWVLNLRNFRVRRPETGYGDRWHEADATGRLDADGRLELFGDGDDGAVELWGVIERGGSAAEVAAALNGRKR